ncbi:MAG: hypothetical protein KBD76_09110 [Bacteriovorax sp.]|nr:hypothetical protein [Bacteriovorax sp.]
MRIFLGAFVFICSLNVLATPQKIEVIFMSVGKVSEVLKEMDRQNSQRVLSLISQSGQNYEDNCVPMGEGCFHPQFGYLNRKPVLNAHGTSVTTPEASPGTERTNVHRESEWQLKTFNAIETNMINCDKGNYFDIFCGKEKPVGKFAEVEIWFDVSSSLRALDYNKDPSFCNRRSFLTKVKEGCKDKVSASVYNTSLKQISDSSSACLSYGGNDESKLLQWIKDSQAKTLLVVTDVAEMSKEMRDFLDSRGAKFQGELKAFTSTDLVDYAKEFVKECSK